MAERAPLERKIPYKGHPPEGLPLVLPGGRKVCGAKNRDDHPGGPWACGRSPVPNGNGRCSKHGGNNLGRPIIHGRRSKFLPRRLVGQFTEAFDDPLLTDYRQNMASIEILICEALQGLDGEGAPARWAKANELYAKLISGDTSVLPELGQVLQGGADALSAEDRAVGLIDSQRKIQEAFHRREDRLEQVITQRQFSATLAVLLALLFEAQNKADEDLPRHKICAYVGRELTRRFPQIADQRPDGGPGGDREPTG